MVSWRTTKVSARAVVSPSTRGEAGRRLDVHGPNSIAEPQGHAPIAILLRAVLNPLVVLLGVLGVSSLATGDVASAAIMAVMLAIGVVLRLVQEWRAQAAVEGLRTLIGVRATVLRDGVASEVPLVEVVPGDVAILSAGDMIPADVRLVAVKDLFVTQSTFTGESFPVEKHADPVSAPERAALDIPNLCWLGTSVASGTATALVVSTGLGTLLGSMSRSLEEPEPPTAFDVGMQRFTWLMVVIVAVMVPLVFLINGLTKQNWGDAFLFALAVGVGITPEMLPMIVTVCLSRGALAMARERMIVKHLDAIQNLGAMDVLCADKTGTLTLDRIILERHCDVHLRDDLEVLRDAWLTSHFQTGLRSLLDRAILDHEELHEHVATAGWEKIDEIPFDFSRRLMSVVVAGRRPQARMQGGPRGSLRPLCGRGGRPRHADGPAHAAAEGAGRAGPAPGGARGGVHGRRHQRRAGTPRRRRGHLRRLRGWID